MLSYNVIVMLRKRTRSDYRLLAYRIRWLLKFQTACICKHIQRHDNFVLRIERICMRGSSDMMAHSGDKDTQKPEQLLQCRHRQYHQQQQQVDLLRAPQDCVPRAQDNTMATLYDLCPRSRHHRHHGGGTGTILNRLTKPKEVTWLCAFMVAWELQLTIVYYTVTKI